MTTFLKFWPVLVIVLNALTVWIAWSLRQLAKNEVERIVAAAVDLLKKADAEASSRLATVVEDVDEHDTRLTKLEEQLKALPQRADFERLEHGFSDLKAVVNGNAATLLGVEKGQENTQKAVDRLTNYLLESRT
ncbi:DUF2730 family protein [Caulobacter soli]|uniref:DUF2730 family protein n=1 Tax=Caulobacter soli TaxID=2708539 RepID=UPI0013ED057E|nr:DUF2730 family protein [Caulobacter soli]